MKSFLSLLFRILLSFGILLYLLSVVVPFKDKKGFLVVLSNGRKVTVEKIKEEKGIVILYPSTLENQKEIIKVAPTEIVRKEEEIIEMGLASFMKSLFQNKYAILAILILYLGLLLTIVRWNILLKAQGIHLKASSLVNYSWLGFFFNGFFPSTIGGDVIKTLYVVKDTGKKASVVSSVIADRVIGLLGLLILSGVSAAFMLNRKELFKPILIVYTCWGCVLFLLAIYKFNLHRQALKLKYMPNKLKEALEKLFDSFSVYKNNLLTIFKTVLLSVIVHFLVCVYVYIWGNTALSVGLPFEQLLVIVPIWLLISFIPISFAGWGTGEAALGFFFKLLGAAYSQGVLISIAYKIGMMILYLPGGIIFLKYFLKNKKITDN